MTSKDKKRVIHSVKTLPDDSWVWDYKADRGDSPNFKSSAMDLEKIEKVINKKRQQKSTIMESVKNLQSQGLLSQVDI